MSKWTDDITLEMVPEQYRPMAEVIGIPQLLALAELYGGATVYIPKWEAVVRLTRDKLIREEYTGYNAEDLARKYDLSVRWVQEICKDAPIPGQMNLFDTG